MSFESELSDGQFCIPECTKCQKNVWPPSEFCDNCFGETSLKKGFFEGKIIEFSKKDDSNFCLVEFEGMVRVLASMASTPKIGQLVRISKCGIKENSYFFQVS